MRVRGILIIPKEDIASLLIENKILKCGKGAGSMCSGV